MNHSMNKLLKPGFVLVAVYVSVLFFSCKKDGETKAVITVKDSSGNGVSGATVTLWQDTAVNPTSHVQANIRVTKTTGSGGTAEFTLELEAYLNILATKDNNEAKGFVRLKEHETVTQSVHF